MSDKPRADIGAIEWRDLTVEDAEQVRDFYADVVGWQTVGVSMEKVIQLIKTLI